MSLINPQLPKQYKNSKVLFEKNLDAWRTATEQGFAISNLNLTQLRKDCFLSTYDFDNDGVGNLPKSLQQQINDITTGAVPISGTTTNTWVINSDGNAVILSSAGLTATHTYTFPDLDGEIVTLNATQTLTNKTLTSPVINGGDITGADIIGAVDISLYSGGSVTTYSDAGVTPTFFIDGATGSFGIPSGQKFFLDGVNLLGDTYVYESSPNNFALVIGGVNIIDSSATAMNLNSVDVSIDTTKKFYLDGGGNTYITEDASDNIAFTSGGVNAFNMSSARSYSRGDLWLDATKKIYFDGGSNTSIRESAADVITFETNGSDRWAIDSSGNLRPVTSGKRVYLHPTADTYIGNFVGVPVIVYNGNIQCSFGGGASGGISTDGLNGWEFGAFTPGGDTVSDGYLTVIVNGGTRKIMTTA